MRTLLALIIALALLPGSSLTPAPPPRVAAALSTATLLSGDHATLTITVDGGTGAIGLTTATCPARLSVAALHASAGTVVYDAGYVAWNGTAPATITADLIARPAAPPSKVILSIIAYDAAGQSGQAYALLQVNPHQIMLPFVSR